MKRALLVASVLGAAIAFPTATSAGIFHGVVIAKEKSRHTLVVATRSGHVRTVRTHARAHVGARVSIHARKLSDGTFRAAGLARAGNARHASFRATVVAKTRHRLIVSAGRSVFDVHMATQHKGLRRGDDVELKVSFTKSGELDDDQLEEVGHSNTVDLEGTITALTAPTADQAGSLTLASKEDDDNGATSFTVVIPAGFDVSGLNVGDDVELKASVSGTTFTLVSLDDDNQGDGGGDGGD